MFRIKDPRFIYSCRDVVWERGLLFFIRRVLHAVMWFRECFYIVSMKRKKTKKLKDVVILCLLFLIYITSIER